MKIRKMQINDYEQVHELILQVHKLHLNERKDIYIDNDPMDYSEYINIINSKQQICYVAEENNCIVGEVIATIKETKEQGIFKYRKILFVEDICVDRKNRGIGIGKMLYNKTVEYCKENEIENIELNVWAFNSDAIKFYEKLGMRQKNIKYEINIKEIK